MMFEHASDVKIYSEVKSNEKESEMPLHFIKQLGSLNVNC
jgi:hypothetical protein